MENGNAVSIDVFDCVNHSCANGGFSFVNGVNSYSCNCFMGYTGELFPN